MKIPAVPRQLFLLPKHCGTHLAKSTFSEYSVVSEGIFGYWLPKGERRQQKLREIVLCCKRSIELNILLIKPDGCCFFAALVTRPLCKSSSIISHTQTLTGSTIFVFVCPPYSYYSPASLVPGYPHSRLMICILCFQEWWVTIIAAVNQSSWTLIYSICWHGATRGNKPTIGGNTHVLDVHPPPGQDEAGQSAAAGWGAILTCKVLLNGNFTLSRRLLDKEIVSLLPYLHDMIV